MKNLCLLLIGCISYLGLHAQEDVTIGKNKKFTSRILGGEITYLEHLPEGYEKSGLSYPVVFMMNGQNVSQFAMDAATLDNLSGDRIPDMILIGISNTGVAGNYWSCPDDSGNLKGAELFASFLKEELIPEIEKNYRTNGYRILEGQSNSALFVIRQFLNDPELFNAYIAASPMFGWCPDFFVNETKSFLKDHPGISKKLYISYGDLDYVQVLKPMNDYAEVLKTAPEGLSWKVDLFGNTGHVPFSTLNNALLFFFSGCTMNAERRQLDVPGIRSHFEALSKEYGFTVNPKAGVLLDMAYDLADDQKTDQAIEIMNYLVGLYPGSEVYNYFLGRLYQKGGDLDSARSYYNKALVIDPGYDAAKVALSGLPGFIYGNQFGSDKDGVAYNPVSDQFGNVYIAGDTKGALAGKHYGKTDGFVTRFDSTGKAVWTVQLGTAGEDNISWVTLDRAGHIYVTGFTGGVTGGISYGKEDIMVARLDTLGNVAWQKQFGSDSTDVGNMVYVDAYGDVYITGATKGTMDGISSGGADCILLKLDPEGNVIWKKQFGTPGGDECQGITGDSTHIYISGYTFGDLGAKNLGSLDGFIAKFTVGGERERVFQFGTAGVDMASHIALDREKNIYIGGSTAGDLGGKNQGEGDNFLSKISRNFEIRWTRQFGTSKWDGINGIALLGDPSGDIVVSGCQRWPSCQSFIRVYSKEGRLRWASNSSAAGKNGGTCGKGVCADTRGNVYHCGNTGGNLFRTIEKPEGHDIILIKLSVFKNQPVQ